MRRTAGTKPSESRGEWGALNAVLVEAESAMTWLPSADRFMTRVHTVILACERRYPAFRREDGLELRGSIKMDVTLIDAADRATRDSEVMNVMVRVPGSYTSDLEQIPEVTAAHPGNHLLAATAGQFVRSSR